MKFNLAEALEETLPSNEYDIIYDYLMHSDLDGFLSEENINTIFFDYGVKEAMEGATIIPGYPEVRYLSNGDPGYPGEPDTVETDFDYKAFSQRVFNSMIADIKAGHIDVSDEKSGLLLKHIDNKEVLDLLFDVFDSCIPSETIFYEKVDEEVLEAASRE